MRHGKPLIDHSSEELMAVRQYAEHPRDYVCPNCHQAIPGANTRVVTGIVWGKCSCQDGMGRQRGTAGYNVQQPQWYALAELEEPAMRGK